MSPFLETLSKIFGGFGKGINVPRKPMYTEREILTDPLRPKEAGYSKSDYLQHKDGTGACVNKVIQEKQKPAKGLVVDCYGQRLDRFGQMDKQISATERKKQLEGLRLKQKLEQEKQKQEQEQEQKRQARLLELKRRKLELEQSKNTTRFGTNITEKDKSPLPQEQLWADLASRAHKAMIEAVGNGGYTQNQLASRLVLALKHGVDCGVHKKDFKLWHTPQSGSIKSIKFNTIGGSLDMLGAKGELLAHFQRTERGWQMGGGPHFPSIRAKVLPVLQGLHDLAEAKPDKRTNATKTTGQGKLGLAAKSIGPQ